MYKNVLQSIDNVDIWPIISLSIFIIFFICMVLWWWHMDKDHLRKMAQMPLEDDESPSSKKERKSNQVKTRNSPLEGRLRGVLTLFFLFGASPLFAQSKLGDVLLDDDMILYLMVGAVMMVSILVLTLAIYLLIVMRTMLIEAEKKRAIESGVEFVIEPSWWSRFTTQATGAVPLEHEETILLEHEYDGIRELDNHLPPWWKWLFYGSIVWGVIYVFTYHVIGTLPLQNQEYENEVAAAEVSAAIRLATAVESGTVIDENTVELVIEAEALADGEKIYQTNCSACHKADGGGSIGPNMTDKYWLHGGGINDVFRTVKYGVVEKGMIPWEPVLTPVQMQNVASYIITLQGTNPPRAKDPQGEIWVEE